MLALSVAAALWAPTVPEVPASPVQWRAPAGCPELDRVQTRIADLLGRSVQPGELEMLGDIQPSAQGWTLTLTTRVGTLEDKRTLEANDCTVLADAAALVAVVMLDPVVAAATIEENAVAADAAVLAPPEPPPEPEPLPITEPDPDPEPEPEREPDPDPPRGRTPLRPAVGLRLRGGGSFGDIPRGTGTFDLGVSFGDFGPSNAFRVELVGAYAIGRTVPDVSEPVRVSLGTVAPRVCAVLPAGPIEVPLCAGVEVGAMRADSDAPGGGVRNALWFAFQAEPGLAWAFADRARLWASAQVFVPVAFPSFEFVDPTDDQRIEAVYTPQPVGVRGLVGLEFLLAGSTNR